MGAHGDYGGGRVPPFGTNSREIEFTQCRVFLGVNRSPLNTWPRWASHRAHGSRPADRPDREGGGPPRDLVVKARPSAARIEFRLGTIELGAAAHGTRTSPRPLRVWSSSGKRTFRPAADDDGLFLRSELAQDGRRGRGHGIGWEEAAYRRRGRPRRSQMPGGAAVPGRKLRGVRASERVNHGTGARPCFFARYRSIARAAHVSAAIA